MWGFQVWVCLQWDSVVWHRHTPLKENHVCGTSGSGGPHSSSWWCCPSQSPLHIWQCRRHCVALCFWSCVERAPCRDSALSWYGQRHQWWTRPRQRKWGWPGGAGYAPSLGNTRERPTSNSQWGGPIGPAVERVWTLWHSKLPVCWAVQFLQNVLLGCPGNYDRTKTLK